MSNDREAIIGKWRVSFKKWTWEYMFTDDGRVVWRDPLNGLSGAGRWAKQQSLINITWHDSTTAESWRCPIKDSGQTGWISASYGVGNCTAEKLKDSASKNIPGVPVDPNISNLPWSRYIDQFTECKYDMNYKFPKNESFAYSNILQLSYEDGAKVEIDMKAELSSDEMTSVEARDSMAQGYVGREGRIFPRKMTPRTTPRLWTAREDALSDQEADANAFIAISTAAVAFILTIPAMPAGMAPPSGVKVQRTRVRGVARAGAISEAEMAAIAAIRRNPEFAKLTVQEVAAIRSYTGEGWKDINLYLRTGGGSPQGRAEAQALIAGLKKLPGYSGKVTRSEAMQVGEAAKRYVPGQTFRNEGMLSTSRGGAVAQREGNVAITIQAAGKAGRDVTKASVHSGKEAEILFPPGTAFKVESVQQFGNAFMVVLKEL